MAVKGATSKREAMDQAVANMNMPKLVELIEDPKQPAALKAAARRKLKRQSEADKTPGPRMAKGGDTKTTTTVNYKINKDTKDLTDAELQKILKESRGKLAKQVALREIERRKAMQKDKSSDAFDKGGMPKNKKKVPAIAISVGMVEIPKGKGKAKMAKGGMAYGKQHMYAAGGSVKMNPGLKALQKERPDVVAKILKKS